MFIRVMNKNTYETRDLTEDQYNRFFDNRDPSDWVTQKAGRFDEMSPEKAQELLVLFDKAYEELDE